MPTLIRLIVVLLVLVGIGFGAMFALVAMVKPRDKEVTVRIPARDLIPSPERDPLVRREIDTTRQPDTPPPVEAAPAVADAPADPAAAEGAGEVRTLQPGIE